MVSEAPIGNNIELVSIIIPTYNRAHLIGETIDSVRSQTFSNWELIIVDDGSTDATEQLVAGFKDQRIQYIRINHCGIFGKIRNFGLRLAKGDYIAFLDSDDIWKPEKLDSQLILLQRYPEATFVFNNVEFFGLQNFPSSPEFEKLFVGNVLIPMLEEKRFVFYPSTLLFRKEAVKKIGFMDEILPFTTDLKYFLKICHHFKGIFVNDRLVKIRKHNQNTTRDVPSEILLENIEILKCLYKEGSIPENFYKLRLSHYFYKMGLAQLKQKKPSKSVFSFYSYVKMNPFHWKGWVRLLQAGITRAKYVW